MPVFEYKAVHKTGRNVKGIIDAPNPVEARSRLRREGVFPTEIKETKGAQTVTAPGNIQFSRGVSAQDIAIMTRQLSTLIGAGIPVVESLTALVDQVENVKLKQALSDVREKVNEGSTMADAMRSHPKVFSGIFVNMIRAGEASGALEVVLTRLADFMENQSQLKGKVTSALMYPLIMMGVGFLALIVIFTFVIPKLVTLYKNMGQVLPMPTRILIGISNFCMDYWYLMVVLAILIPIGFNAYVKTENGKKRYHRLILSFPLFGPMFRMVAVARFANTLSTLLASGVPILLAMDIVKNIVNNVILESVINNVRTNIQEGDSIAEPLRRSGEFPPLVTHMIAIGEKTGEVEHMLAKVAETYNRQVDTRVATLTSLLEPILIVVMAVVIGAVVFSVLLPIVNMDAALK